MPENSLPEPTKEFLRAIARLLLSTPTVIPLLVLPLTVWGCYRVWARTGDDRVARWVAGVVLVMGLGDGLLLLALPRLDLSFGPVGLPRLGMILVRGDPDGLQIRQAV